MAYLNRTIRLAFDGTDDSMPKLGDDIWVVIRNPMLMPGSALSTGIEIDPNNVDMARALQHSQIMAARLIESWNVYNPDDPNDPPTPYPLPATPEMVATLPVVIVNKIAELAGQALNPQ